MIFKTNKLVFAFLFSLLIYQGCILEDFDTIPINIPVSLPVILVDPGSQTGITSEAIFCLDSNEIYEDYQGKIKKLMLVEMAFRFSDVIPAEVVGDMSFMLKENDISGNVLIDHHENSFTPADFLIPGSPSVIDLSQNQLDLMNQYLSGGGTCFYGSVTIENLTPANSQKFINGYVDMLFKAETEF